MSAASRAAITSFKDLIVWQKAFDLCGRLYRATREFPSEERFGLIAETRKTARSVVYNIAEGHRRHSTRDFARFLDISAGSAAELETQLLLAHLLGYMDDEAADAFLARLAEVQRMLAGLLRTLRARLEAVLPVRP